jgi:hypothetical protein
MTPNRPIPFIPRTAVDALALEIARAFNDEVRLPFYRQVCAAHVHSLVYRAYRQALAMPEHQLKKSRRALFIYLIRQHDHQADNSGN